MANTFYALATIEDCYVHAFGMLTNRVSNAIKLQKQKI